MYRSANPINRAMPAGKRRLRTLFVFGFLAFAPSKECGRCLLTKFGLTWFTARLFWKLVKDKRCLAFNIFDALSPHTFAAAYLGPINTTGHNAFL
jgi:hypothetical protein